jgi:hypothetical protein
MALDPSISHGRDSSPNEHQRITAPQSTVRSSSANTDQVASAMLAVAILTRFRPLSLARYSA